MVSQFQTLGLSQDADRRLPALQVLQSDNTGPFSTPVTSHQRNHCVKLTTGLEAFEAVSLSLGIPCLLP